MLPPPLSFAGAGAAEGGAGGGAGVAAGVTLFDAADAALVPTAFVAVTVNVYPAPLTNPMTVIGDVPPVAVTPLGKEVTV